MMEVVINVTVKCGISAYTASIGRSRGSSTMDGETAVKRAAERYVAGTKLRLARIEPLQGGEYRVVLTNE